MSTHSLAKIDAYFIQNLVDDVFTLLLVFHTGGIIDGVVHHLLPLVHDIVLLFKLHSNALKRGKVHLPVHAPKQC